MFAGMANYRKRLEADLDRWIDAGWVTPDKRGAILASVPERRIEAAAALGFAGAALLGIAVIAFIMANWDELPKFGRVVLIIGFLAAAISGAIWAGDKRPGMQSGLALIAALVFAAGIGLIGQMYNLPGEPWYAFAMAGFGALGLCWASGRAAPGVAGAAFIALAHVSADGDVLFSRPNALIGASDIALLAFIGLMIMVSREQRTALLRHPLLLLAGYASWIAISRMGVFFNDDWRWDNFFHWRMAGFAALWAALGAWAWITKWRAARIVVSYAAWFALIGLCAACYDNLGASAGFVLVSIGILGFGRSERLGWVSGASIVGLIAAVNMILFNLGIDLMTIAALFFVLAIPALIGAFFMARRRKGQSA
jgi:uncharacterized membrane protein